MRKLAVLMIVGSAFLGCGEDENKPAGTGGAGGAGSGGKGGSGTGGAVSTGGSSGSGGVSTGGAGGAGGAGGKDAGSGGAGDAKDAGSGGATGDAKDGGTGGATGDGGGAAPSVGGTHPACPTCKSIFDGTTLNGWMPNGAEKWAVDSGAILSTGAAAGALITTAKYDKYRLIYSWKMLAADGHQANMLVWCRNVGARYCGGVQFQPPGTDIWDYGPANTSLKGKAGLTKADVPKGAAGMCEMLVDSTAGTFKVACCPLGTAATCKTTPVGMLNYGSPMPKSELGFQAHNPNHKIRWWDIFLEENPTSDEFLTSK